MKVRISALVSIVLGAAVAASGTPSPSVSFRLSSADALLGAASTVISECMGPMPAMMIAGSASQSMTESGIVDPSRPVMGAAWIAGLDGNVENANGVFLVSIPALSPESGAKLREALDIADEDVIDGVCTNLEALPFPAALVFRDDAIVLSAVSIGQDGALPEGVPTSPAALAAIVPSVFDGAFLREDALLAFRFSGEFLSSMNDWNKVAFANPGAPNLDDFLSEIDSHLGIKGFGSMLGKLLDAAKAQEQSVSGATVDLWISPEAGLVMSCTTDLAGESALAGAVSEMPALDLTALPDDVPPGAIAWFAASSIPATPVFNSIADMANAMAQNQDAGNCAKAAEALSLACSTCVKSRNLSGWMAEDSQKRLAGASSAQGIAIEDAKALFSAYEGIASQFFPSIDGAAVSSSPSGDSVSFTVPVDAALKALAKGVAEKCEKDLDEDDLAGISKFSPFVERLFGKTRVFSFSSSEGTIRSSSCADGADPILGTKPDPAPALSLAKYVSKPMRPVYIGEARYGAAAKSFCNLYPELFTDNPMLKDMIFSGVSSDKPVVFTGLAGTNCYAEVASVPLSDLHLVSNIAQIAFTMGQEMHGGIQAFDVDGTIFEDDVDEDDTDEPEADGDEADDVDA